MPEATPRKRGGKSSQAKQPKLRQKISAYRATRPPRGRKQIPRVAVPSFFTLMNLLCGFGAITQIFEGKFDMAGWLILLAAFFDALDGMMARLTNSSSLFGVELDSLSDIVSFGVAPGVLVYVFGLNEFGLLGLIVSAMPALCGAVRLARFNVDVELEGDKPEYFKGLPIPAQAAAIVTLILNFDDATWFNDYSISSLSLLIPFVAVLAGLMVSTIPFDALPKPSPGYIRNHPYKSGACLLSILLTIFLQQIGLLISIMAYVLMGLVNAALRVYKAVMSAPIEGADGEEEEFED
ncbi:MAG: CDP-diacylglycerol--serine O-phosphatidyltransferase [Rhodothermales bacterium]